MMNKESLQQLLEAGARAPSGDNSQPWRFVVKDQSIYIHSDPKRDNPFLNFEQSGTLIACGAVIENIIIASTSLGIATKVVLFPETSDPHVVARIELKESNLEHPDPLQEAIFTRETNRRTYQNRPLPESIREQLLSLSDLTHGISIKIAEGKAMKQLGYAGSQAEIAILEHEELHTLLFSNVVWTKAEEVSKKAGLFAKTLELAPPQEFMFKLCRNWSFMRVLNKIGFAKFIAFDDAKKYATGSAYVAIISASFDRKTFVHVGRTMERAWMLANKLGLSVHPITATLFFGHRIRTNNTDGLNAATWERMRKANEILKDTFQIQNGEHLMFLMRIGYADAPSERSSKKQPIVEYT